MKSKALSLQLYLGYFPLSKRFGINPNFSNLAKSNIISLANSKFPVKSNNPLKERKVSLPHTLVQPVLK